MDYETVEIDCCKKPRYYIDPNFELGWERGELAELRLPICGNIEADGLNLSMADLLIGSNTKYVRMVLKDIWDEIVEIQEITAKEIDFEDELAIAYFEVDEVLSNRLRSGSYNLFVYLINKVPPATEVLKEKTTMNMLLTCPEGLEVTVY